MAGIQTKVHLWPRLEQKQIWSLFRQSQVYVSPSIHDGTPNSFLEALACGCFPVVGDIDSFREWIIPGKNGSLVDANSNSELARAILDALQDPALLTSAKKENAHIIASRADYGHCMAMTAAFYKDVIGTCV
jgi:glycosyltransferase involved in cell wall biosynthesis